MPHIVLTDEQKRILAKSTVSVEVRDAQGDPIGNLNRFSQQDLEAIERWRKNRSSPR